MLTVASTAQRLIRLGSPPFPTLPPVGRFERTEGSPPLARETSRCILVFGWPVLGPDHEAIIRFGGEAPRRRAHSNERFDDHVPARVTTTSDRDRLIRQR
jgi:hypothetical protein